MMSMKYSLVSCIMSKENILLYIIIYLVIINVITFIVYGLDKWKAQKAKWRIRESTLLGMAAVGGSIGALFAMKILRHKTLHPQFKYGVPLMLVAQIAMGVAIWYFWMR